MSRASLYLKVLEDISNRLQAAKAQYDKTKDADELIVEITTILRGSTEAGESENGNP